MKKTILPLVAGLAFTLPMTLNGETKKPNILFIAVDDLKPNAGAYGDRLAKTPGMDRLAKEGVVFTSSYCQQAICAATRASIMTGMRPDKTRIWDLVTDFRQVNPNVVTMPQYFKSMGYETAAMGKIYHMGSTGPGHDAPSWSIPYRDPKCKTYALPGALNERGKGTATECADVPDATYHDGKICQCPLPRLIRRKLAQNAIGLVKSDHHKGGKNRIRPMMQELCASSATWHGPLSLKVRRDCSNNFTR